MARERGLTVDMDGFDKLMEEQRARARAAQKKQVIELSQVETTTPTKFVGYDKLETPAKVLEVVGVKDKTAVILDTSPLLRRDGRPGRRHRRDDRAAANSGASPTRRRPATPGCISSKRTTERSAVGARGARSRSIRPRRARHPAPPHRHAPAALGAARSRQPGSLAERLLRRPGQADLRLQQRRRSRPQQVADVERLVNERILENAAVSWTEVPYADVKDRKDIMQFFGEKYGDVRPRRADRRQAGRARRLLDGTLRRHAHPRHRRDRPVPHRRRESAIAAGVRRIEAVAGLEAYDAPNEELQLIKTVAGKVNSPVGELEKKIESLLAQQKELEKQLKAMQQKQAAEIARGLAAKAQTIGSTPRHHREPRRRRRRFPAGHRRRAEGPVQRRGRAGRRGERRGGPGRHRLARVHEDRSRPARSSRRSRPIVGGKGGGKPGQRPRRRQGCRPSWTRRWRRRRALLG